MKGIGDMKDIKEHKKHFTEEGYYWVCNTVSYPDREEKIERVVEIVKIGENDRYWGGRRYDNDGLYIVTGARLSCPEYYVEDFKNLKVKKIEPPKFY